MATPEVVASDAANPQPDEPSRAEEAAPVAEPEEASDLGAVAAAPAVEEVAAGDAPPATTPTSTSTSSAAVLPPPASPASAAAPGPPPPRPQFAGSPAYMAPPASSPAPAFSYNVLPRAPPSQHMGSGLAHQQLASAPALMARPMPPAALQPPAPRQYFGNRPSFSYNVVSHANASLPTEDKPCCPSPYVCSTSILATSCSWAIASPRCTIPWTYGTKSSCIYSVAISSATQDAQYSLWCKPTTG
uniref:Uncharacterized protein n=1 Tax=Triticum urartu TaxID=4572 RepID=A0A8R7P3C4_TRIUA